MKKIKSYIPNTITCLNLFFGCMACVAAFKYNYILASYFIYTAAICDFFDGFAARLLNEKSPIGKDLDSLADCVSFGVAPGFILYSWLQNVTMPGFASNYQPYIAIVAFVIPVFSALRLAKFNIDTRQTTSFIGLPTPACTIFFASLAAKQPCFFVHHGYMLILLILFFAFLMVAEFPMFALKFKHYGWKGNELRYAFIALSAILLLLYKISVFHIIILLYIIISAISAILQKKKATENTAD